MVVLKTKVANIVKWCDHCSVESVYKNCERLNEACYTKLCRLIANHYTIMYTEPDWKYLPPPPLPAEDRRR